jgi:hypothetical protein
LAINYIVPGITTYRVIAIPGYDRVIAISAIDQVEASRIRDIDGSSTFQVDLMMRLIPFGPVFPDVVLGFDDASMFA